MTTPTTVMPTRPREVAVSSVAAVVVTMLVASVSYAGAVTTMALAVFVLPAVVLASAIVAPLALGRRFGTACIVGLSAVLGWAELVNVISGTTNGPAARSSFLAGACAALAVLLVATRAPGSFLVPVAGAVFGAMALGAGSEVRSVAVAAALVAVLALRRVERDRRGWTARPSRSPAAGALLLLVIGASVGAVLIQGTTDHRRPDVLARAQTDASIKPQWTDPLSTTVRELQPSRVLVMPYGAGTARLGLPKHPAPRAHAKHQHSVPRMMAPSTSAAQHTRAERANTGVNRVLLALLALLGLLIAWLDARLMSARLLWWRVRRRMRRGSAPTDTVVGAWSWAGLRLAACRRPLPVSMSPDVAMRDDALADLPERVAVPLRELARLTSAAAFAASADEGTAARAWALAEAVNRGAENELSWFGRLRLAFRAPETFGVTPRRVRHLRAAMSHD